MAVPTLHELAERIAILEGKLASTERKTTGVAPSFGSGQNGHGDIPWHVLAAAIAAVVPGPYRIKSVMIVSPDSSANLWASEGRREHCYSHRIR